MHYTKKCMKMLSQNEQKVLVAYKAIDTLIEEKKIFYIIKKAISDAKITLSKKEGGALDSSHGYEVAKETETVVMKVEVPDGYKLKDAWCDDEKQIRIISCSSTSFI